MTDLTPHFGEPNWGPLEEFLPPEYWGQFMWMCEYEGAIQAYKHCDTRQYLHLTTLEDGSAAPWRWDGWFSEWQAIPPLEALNWAFDYQDWAVESPNDRP